MGLGVQAREFHSLASFDEFVTDLEARGSEAENIGVLSNSFLIDPDLLRVPPDPFSPEYKAAVLNIHARLSGRARYDEQTMEHTPLNVPAQVAKPAVYQPGGRLGEYLESYGHMIRRLEAEPGMRILELGCGDGEISLHLARLGCEIVAVDIEPGYLEIIQRKAERLDIPIKTVCGSFLEGVELGPFDRVFFYQAFHHALAHQELVEAFDRILSPDGFAVFGAEPIIDPDGIWKLAVPYPWGPRLDGLSLRAMRRHGWMELGFHQRYFADLLDRSGWTCDSYVSESNGLQASIVSRRKSA
jgi:SAM-dependent methyltransferase